MKGISQLVALVGMVAVLMMAAIPVMAEEGGQGLEKGPLSSLVVVEMFSSQACVFCPPAERIFTDLVASPYVIGLSCHVDYFDVSDNSSARDFCSERQSWYMTALRAGPNYTPQMIFNGVADAVGYRHEEITEAMGIAQMSPVKPLVIQQAVDDSQFLVEFPETGEGQDEGRAYAVWLAKYDRPRLETVSEGHDLGRRMTYSNLISRLEPLDPWNGESKYLTVKSALEQENKGFAILVQDYGSGRIIAAGRYEPKVQ